MDGYKCLHSSISLICFLGMDMREIIDAYLREERHRKICLFHKNNVAFKWNSYSYFSSEIRNCRCTRAQSPFDGKHRMLLERNIAIL